MIAVRTSVTLAEAVLMRTFGGPVRLDTGVPPRDRSEQSNVLRCNVLDGPSEMPSSVIIKRVNINDGETYDPHANEGPAIRLFTEWASLEFLSQLDTEFPLAPRFYGGDHAAGLIVMEDLGQGTSLVQPITGNNRTEAIDALDVFFRSLGRLGATTYGHQDEYRRIRTRLGAPEPLSQPKHEDERKRLETLLRAVCERVNLTLDTTVEQDIAQAATMDTEAGPFLAFSQSDTCPDNCIRQGAWMRFFDFEWGWFRNALSDGARARSNFASCWCVNRLPEDVIERCESVYRSELMKGCPAASDDRLFNRALVTACAYWTLFALDFIPQLWDEDRPWGISSVRQRMVTRFELLAQTTEKFGYLEALGGLAATLARQLKALWPDLEPMPFYPPFR